MSDVSVVNSVSSNELVINSDGSLNAVMVDTSIEIVNTAATPVYVTPGADGSANGNITTQNLNSTGEATDGSAIGFADLGGGGTVTAQVVGTYTGALTPQVSQDGTNWVSLGSTALLNVNTGACSATIPSGTNGIYQVNVIGYANFRLAALAAVTGTAVVTMKASQAVGRLALDAPLPAGGNQIGTAAIVLTNPTTFTLTSAASTNLNSLKSSAGNLLAISYDNVSAATKYLKIYNATSGGVTVGTSVPVLTIPLPANSGGAIPLGTLGARLSSGIQIAITGAMIYSDTTAIAAGDVHLVISYT